MSESPPHLDRDIRALARFDLNLLVVFHALSQIGHVGNTARALGLSQPAVSHALKRLRGALADQLFVRTPRGVLPTPKAQQLAPRVARLLTAVHGEVLNQAAFDPHKLERTFIIRTTGLIELALLQALVPRLEREAPGVRLAVKSANPGFPHDELERGACDLAIAGFFERVPPGFKRQKVRSDALLSAVRASHPRLGKARALSLDAFCAERHLLIAPGGQLDSPLDAALRKKGRRRVVVAGVSEFLASGWVLASSDCILTAPASLLAHFAAYVPLKTFPPPLKLKPVDIAQIWHERQQQDPAHAWLRGVVAEAL